MPTTTLTRRLSLLAGSATAVLAAVIPAGAATAAGHAPAAPSAKTAGAASALRTAPTSKDLSVIGDMQDTGYWCGPAAVRNALSAVANVSEPSQQTLANYMGTTTDGTSSVAKTTAAMDHYDTTGFPYVSVYISGQTATQAQKDKLKHDVVSDVSLGHALVANIVGTAVDTAGRSHTYSGGHYITLRGYSSSGTYTHIYDPANDTYYSMETGRLATWIALRGYTW